MSCQRFASLQGPDFLTRGREAATLSPGYSGVWFVWRLVHDGKDHGPCASATAVLWRLRQRVRENWKKAIQSKINSASKVQDRWIKLSDEEWDKELDIIKELKTEEFLDFIKADFGLSNMVKLAMSHPKLAVRQLFNLVKSK